MWREQFWIIVKCLYIEHLLKIRVDKHKSQNNSCTKYYETGVVEGEKATNNFG